jgi:metal transporter CNNM
MAIIISVTVLLFVGEIIPQAVCTGPSQMKIASCLAPFTSFLMYLTYPISYPIAKFMDYLIGVHGKSRFCNSDLKSIIELHVKEIISNYSSNQIGYFTGFLNIMNKEIGELILPIDKVLKIDYNARINKITLKKIIDSGYSRIPVYENKPNHLIGILRTKQLVGQDLSVPCTINQLGLNLTRPIHAFEDTLFLDLFEKFKSGKSHMAFIHQKELETEYLNKVSLTSDNYDIILEKNIPLTPIVGIITLENLFEFWFNIQILDEEDYRAQDTLHRSLTRSRKKLFDAIGIEKVSDKINKLYDDSEKKERNYNDEFSNDYQAF